jgi:hypothetical protein
MPALFSTQGYTGKIVAGNTLATQTILDTFRDEDIKVSTNILELFDLGEIPGAFTRTITLPGTKKNNQFFEHYYDISVYEPDLFNTNQIVSAYIDFDSFYIANGYLQLKKVNIIENKFVDSYEVEIFGIISNFSVDTRSSFLTDITSLSAYNHTSSLANITSSWNNGLFNGDIVYPMAEYGQQIFYSQETVNEGIDEPGGSLSVQDYKPAIRLKKVWDAIFEEFGYTYTGSFWNESWLDSVYLICNNNLKVPIYTDDISTYGLGKITNISGSAIQQLTQGVTQSFALKAKSFDYTNNFTVGTAPTYNNEVTTYLTWKLNLAFEISKSNATPGSGAPQFTIYFHNTNNNTHTSAPLTTINDYMLTVANSRTTTATEIFNLRNVIFRTPEIDSGSLNIKIGYNFAGVDNFVVNLNPNPNNQCSLELTKINQIADGKVIDIPLNMPSGNSGIRVIDFITAVQKKFNLIIYADKVNPNQFIVETFNNWYKQGKIVDFNNIVNLKDKIEYIPANQLGYRQIKFSDAQDNDYISTLFKRTNNRTYGESNYYDTDSFYSQGNLNVNTEVIASGPLGQVPGSVYTSSAASVNCTSYKVQNTDSSVLAEVVYTNCAGNPASGIVPPSRTITLCAQSDTTVTIVTGNATITVAGDCSPALDNGTQQYPVWIPYFISDQNYNPSKVLPRIFFYNGLIPATPYYLSGYTLPNTSSISESLLFKYPYFDNYSTGSINNTQSIFPNVDARSLLFNNEVATLGSTPQENLISEYWDTYLELLYNPRTRLVNCTGVIPLGQYIDLELNDIVEFRGSYYHLRAINDYNLKTGECNLQLLGPIIADTISEITNFTPFNNPCDFTYTISEVTVPVCENYTATKLSTFLTTDTISWVDCDNVSQSMDLYNPALNPGELETITFCALSNSLVYNGTQISVVDNGLCTSSFWNTIQSKWESTVQLWNQA